MTDRRIFEVLLSPSGWVVKEQGGFEHSTWSFTDKLDAVKDGITLANLSRPSRLLIRSEDGKVEMERTYGD